MRCMQPFEQQSSCSVDLMVFPRPDKEQNLLWDTYKIAIGCDGSLVADGDYVYVLPLGEVMQIDYFHGCIDENHNGIPIPVCQVRDDSESNFLASELISLRGFVAIRIINLQRRWRQRQLRLAKKRKSNSSWDEKTKHMWGFDDTYRGSSSIGHNAKRHKPNAKAAPDKLPKDWMRIRSEKSGAIYSYSMFTGQLTVTQPSQNDNHTKKPKNRKRVRGPRTPNEDGGWHRGPANTIGTRCTNNTIGTWVTRYTSWCSTNYTNSS